MVIKLKRNRHIANKQELTRLQRKFEAQLSQVDKLEREKTIRASATALTIGFLGSVFLAASVMLFHDNTFLSFILGIPGLIGWILPYRVYTNIKTRRSQELSPQINELYDLLYDTCKQAHKLLTLQN
ncbi:DUF2207 domain-containing protein [Oenococcus sp. UCMA 16435]|nr:DUF2207 domain-containing protein [Oenococcus sp. UCMA 16435]MDI4583880.1 hypothetical protein [Oenococcus sp. UCMA 14587]